jgi:predicted outer membrane repeat protein
LTHRAINFQGTPSSFMLENITFTGGSALGEGMSSYGGAMMFNDDSAPTIVGCVFVDNHAGRGGAIFTYDLCASNIIDCTFTNNTAISYGGAISMSVDSTPSIEGCTFNGNSAGSTGGALSIWNEAAPTVSNCTFYGNSASGGGSAAWCRWGGSPVFVNTIIAFSVSGNAISCEDDTSTPVLSCCDIYGNAGGDWVDCIEGLDASDGNISEDPLFADAENQDFHLSAGSPCIAFTEPNTECDLIGAFAAEDVAVESSSWGRIKAGYHK